MLCLQCVCHIQYTDLLHPNIHGNFVWIIIKITINPKGLDSNPSNFLPCLNLLLDYNNLLLDYNNLLLDYNNPLADYNNNIIIYYY